MMLVDTHLSFVNFNSVTFEKFSLYFFLFLYLSDNDVPYVS